MLLFEHKPLDLLNEMWDHYPICTGFKHISCRSAEVKSTSVVTIKAEKINIINIT